MRGDLDPDFFVWFQMLLLWPVATFIGAASIGLIVGWIRFNAPLGAFILTYVIASGISILASILSVPVLHVFFPETPFSYREWAITLVVLLPIAGATPVFTLPVVYFSAITRRLCSRLRTKWQIARLKSPPVSGLTRLTRKAPNVAGNP